MKVRNIALFAGGTSSEHAISLISALSIQRVLQASDSKVHIIGIDKEGQWWHYPDGTFTNGESSATAIALAEEGRFPASIVAEQGQATLRYAEGTSPLDVALPILHGPGGEDGTIQGFFETVGLPYIGCNVSASAVAIDKQLTKDVLTAAGIPVADGCVLFRCDTPPRFDDLATELNLPLYIKPACQGSSVGISAVSSQAELDRAFAEAFKWDSKVLIEGCVKGREIECAVLGNRDPQASPLGEIRSTEGFYDFESKYVDADAAELLIPAAIDPETAEAIKASAIKAFRAIGASGLARVDFLLRADGSFVINEINTMPGFTSISMYPKLWQEARLNYAALLEKLITLALASKV